MNAPFKFPPVLTAPVALVDFETRSEADVRDCGAYRYAEDPSTQIICMSWRIGDAPAKLWTPWVEGEEEYEVEVATGRGKKRTTAIEIRREPIMVYRPDLQPFPQELVDHVEQGGVIEAHSAQFERAIWREILVKQFGIAKCARWKDTQATCAYRGLPLDLLGAGTALDLDILKDTAGKDILNKISKPRKPTKADKRKWNNTPSLFHDCFNYCIRDNDAEHALKQTIGDLPASEYRVWILDQIINSRGVLVDVQAVHAAQSIANKSTMNMEAELQELTQGAITTGNQREKIREWLGSEHKIILPDMTKGTIKETLKDKGIPKFDKSEPTTYGRRVLEIRQELSRTSPAKLQAMLDSMCADHRVRGMLQYHGAFSGRWAGRLVQPQNFPRPKVNGKPFKGDINDLICMLLFEEPEVIRLCYGPEMETLAASLRGMFIAAKGKKLIVADFSSIEARLVLWLAGQVEAMEIFRKADAKEGPDIYCHLAGDIYGRLISKADEEERQLGKIGVLGCGYQMGPDRLQEQAHDDYELDLPIDLCEKIVKTYRTTFDKVPVFWREINSTACYAVTTGKPQEHRGVIYEVVEDAAGKWLTCRLHNGKRLWYYNPSVTWEEAGAVTIKKYPNMKGKKFPKLWYEGRDNKRGGMWTTISTYGGMLTENIVQALAREIMVEAMIRAEQSNYPIILTVHDEIISEVDKDFSNHKEFEKLMSILPAWCQDMPINAEGWEGPRYRK